MSGSLLEWFPRMCPGGVLGAHEAIDPAFSRHL
jgi:hypothetical protein